MSINDIIIYIMAAFAALGALDKIFGNRFGLGAKFEEGISAIAGVSLAMVGINSLAPVLGNLLEPVVVPVFQFLGADPAMFAGCFFANDSGAATLAAVLTADANAADFAGLIVGSMMGVTVIFTIPISMEMTKKEDQNYVAIGVLAGLVTIPLGCFVGGIVAGCSAGMVLRNLFPILLLSALIAVGLWKFQNVVVKGFTWFGKIMMGIIILGLGAGIVETLTGIVIVPGMTPVREGFAIAADIAMVLSGAYTLMYVITKVFQKPLLKLGRVFAVNEATIVGMIAAVVNSIPTFGMVKDMNARGKVISIAFSVSAAFALGDHLGFTAGYKPEMIAPMIVGKLAGGITAVMVALWITRSYRTEEGAL